MKVLITISEFRESYGVSRSTVYRLEKGGNIGFVHVGRAVRIPLADAEKWFASLLSKRANDE
jgi:excisionase family DNA binding protein